MTFIHCKWIDTECKCVSLCLCCFKYFTRGIIRKAYRVCIIRSLFVVGQKAVGRKEGKVVLFWNSPKLFTSYVDKSLLLRSRTFLLFFKFSVIFMFAVLVYFLQHTKYSVLFLVKQTVIQISDSSLYEWNITVVADSASGLFFWYRLQTSKF